MQCKCTYLHADGSMRCRVYTFTRQYAPHISLPVRTVCLPVTDWLPGALTQAGMDELQTMVTATALAGAWARCHQAAQEVRAC